MVNICRAIVPQLKNDERQEEGPLDYCSDHKTSWQITLSLATESMFDQSTLPFQKKSLVKLEIDV